MRIRSFIVAIPLWLPAAPLAQGYSLDWRQVSGGGSSSGGIFSINGTAGQADAGVMAGGSYSVIGGFWSLISLVPTPGAPCLTITRASGSAVLVSWPSSSTGFALQQSTNLPGTDWVAAPQTPSDDGTNKTVSLNLSGGRLYLRLKK